MNFPTSVTILGYHYRIEYVKQTRECHPTLQTEEAVGTCISSDNGDTGVIRVYTDRDPFPVLDTLIHEMLHAVFNRNHLLSAAIKQDIGEEAYINELACALANVLVDNHWVELPEKIEPTVTRINQ